MIPKNLKLETKGTAINFVRSLQRAIKENCYRCMGAPPTPKQVDCELADCPLYLFRPWAK